MKATEALMLKLTAILGLTLLSLSAQAGSQLRTIRILKQDANHLRVIGESSREVSDDIGTDVTTREYPQFIIEHMPVQDTRVIEISSTDSGKLNQWLKVHAVSPMETALEEGPKDEVRTIVSGGPAANRIDLVFMGDGYTASEREKFFADITRLTNDMFVGKTFKSYLPLFNVHAVFRPSNQSGIGRGSAIDTAYRLYREGETLRAIFPGNPSAIRSSCRQAPGCDYPVVIANDPYYGGLGGEFAISTSSVNSGTVVLRHELGHNFGRVGEEYDGGGYFGANYSTSASNPGWSHWATDRGPLRAEPMMARFIDWPWHKLDKGPFTANLSSDGGLKRTWIRLSASGIETPETLQITLDGQKLPFQSPNRLDRSFINIELPGLSPGDHKLSFSETVNDHNNWLSSLTVHEYAEDFHDSVDYVGAYPNFSKDLSEDGFRPTNESCLMRDMTHEYFCPVCQENNWFHFFDNISLIDEATARLDGTRVTASVKTLGLGQFGAGKDRGQNERLSIIWIADGVELTQFKDQASITWEPTSRVSNVTVQVALASTEIRKRPITAKRSINL
jgi:hypothetical protein